MTAPGATLERPVRTQPLRARRARTEPLRAVPLPEDHRGARSDRSRRSWASWLATVIGLLVWSFTLRPVALGGPATFVGVEGSSMESTFYEGDLVVLHERDAYEVGDVIAYRIPKGAPGEGHNIVHRIVAGDGSSGYTTQGDHNTYTDLWRPVDGDVIGEVWLEIPGVARWAGHLRTPSVLAAVVGVATFVVLMAPARWPLRGGSRRRRA